MPPKQDEAIEFGGRTVGCGSIGVCSSNWILLSESAKIGGEDREHNMVRASDIDRTARNGNSSNFNNMRNLPQSPYGMVPASPLLSLSSVAVAQQRLQQLQQLQRMRQPPPLMHPSAHYFGPHHAQPHFHPQPHFHQLEAQPMQPFKKRLKSVYGHATLPPQDPTEQPSILHSQGVHPSRMSSPPQPTMPPSKQRLQPPPLDPAPQPQEEEPEQHAQLKWEVEYIPLLVSDQNWNTGEEKLREINLAEFINNKSARSNKKWKSDPTKRLYLPREYSTNTPLYRRTVFAPVIARACAQAGFGITMKGWEKGLQAIRFVCNRNRKGGSSSAASNGGVDSPCCMPVNSKPDIASKNPSTPTSAASSGPKVSSAKTDGKKKRKRYVPPRIRPTASEEVCPFSFYVYWEPAQDDDDTKGRWFIVNNGAGCCVHMGHPRKLPSEIRIKNDGAAPSNSNSATNTPNSRSSKTKQRRKRRQPKDEDSVEDMMTLKPAVPRSSAVKANGKGKPSEISHKEASSSSTDSIDDDDRHKKDASAKVNGMGVVGLKRCNSLGSTDASAVSTSTEEVGDDDVLPRSNENGVSLSEFPSDRQLLNGHGQNHMLVMEPMTQQRRTELQRRLDQGTRNGAINGNADNNYNGNNGDPAFELLLPLYKELTGLVSTDPDRVQFAMTQLQDVVTQLRRHDAFEDTATERKRSDASDIPSEAI